MKIDFDNIKQNYPIVDIAQKLGINVNNNNTCLCMFHNDNNPSMSFDTKTNRYKCFACDAKGSNIDLVANILGYDVKKSCEFITGHNYSSEKHSYDKNYYSYYSPNNASIKNKKNQNQNTNKNTNIYTDFINLLDDDDAIAYLSKRKITAKIVAERKIKNLPLDYSRQNEITKSLQKIYSDDELIQSGLFAISKKNNRIYNRFFAHRLIIPIIQNGAIESLQSRLIDDDKEVHSKYNNLKGTTAIFNIDILDKLPKGSNVLICEGIIDCLSWNRLTFNCIAIGSSGNIGKLDEDTIKKLSKFNIFIAGDNDIAGESMNDKIAKLLDDNCIRTYTLNLQSVANALHVKQNVNDINEVLLAIDMHKRYSASLGELDFCRYQSRQILFLDYAYFDDDELANLGKADIEMVLKIKKTFDGQAKVIVDRDFYNKIQADFFPSSTK